ncbi:MAG: hypothetical protein ACD_60C00128G0002 [uncultured bacterium]|nr:MAG: hypothetical protein ACD_60C00128G0002 [uncultured bacterium]HCB30791.1 type VI secretion system membrane subunit TssM [Acinetobacter lwoffii]
MTLKNIYKQQAIPLMVLAALSIAVWTIGPFLTIAHAAPLASPEKRLYIIAAFFLAWLLKCIFFDEAPLKKNAIPCPPEILKRLQALHGRFQGALNFLKKPMVSKHGVNVNLARLPWYLLIGPKGAGKTSLLAHSGINFILAKQFKKEDGTMIPPSETCDWWVTRDLVMVDVPGPYFTTPLQSPDKKEPLEAMFSILWKKLLNLISSLASKIQLNGVVIALNLPELMKKPSEQQRTQLIHDLKKRITDLRAQFGPALSFHFVITKCDLLPGFLEFFGENGSDELSQSWGITLPSLESHEKLTDVFSHRFNALIKRLNKQLIWRLQQERNLYARPYIKDFPLHIERLKENIIYILKALMLPDLCLQSIYLTSATQLNTEESMQDLRLAENRLTHQALQMMRAPLMPNRVYFIKQLISQNFFHSVSTLSKHTEDYTWMRRAVYATSISAIAAAAIILGRDFREGVQKTYSIQNDLARYQLFIQEPNQGGDRLIKALPLLDALQRTAENTHHSLSHIENALSFYSHKSQQTAETVYLEALQTIVVPEIKNDLENYLQTANNKSPALTYRVLKAYLMLADTKNRDANFIANIINKINATKINSPSLNQLVSHINTALNHRANPIELDQNLMTSIRKQLANLPNNELALVILKNKGTNNSDSGIRLGTDLDNPSVFISKNIPEQIPNMFTARYFSAIMNTDITEAANEALKGNWVLGNITSASNETSVESLTAQLRNQYLANYADTWENILANIQPYTPKSLLRTDEMIQNLTSNHSPLLQLLQTIQQNVALPEVIAVSPKIQSLNNLLLSDNNPENALYQVFVTLKQLHVYLQTILTETNINKAAFNAARARMQNGTADSITATHDLALRSPEPLKTWLNSIANESWSLILKTAAHHIEEAWQTDIIPTYNGQIAHHYPFNQTSAKEIDLDIFTQFLGHHGKLGTFYQSYLKPFINDNDAKWAWKTIDNQHIPLSNTALTQLQYAGEVQRMFFPEGNNKLWVEFSLQPVSLQRGAKSVALTINGEEITYSKHSAHALKNFVWPGNQGLHGTTLQFVSNSNQPKTTTLKGDWAWFKLVSNATQNINSRKALSLNFTNNGHSAKYLLLTEGHMNPFLPLNLTRFELPQELV